MRPPRVALLLAPGTWVAVSTEVLFLDFDFNEPVDAEPRRRPTYRAVILRTGRPDPAADPAIVDWLAAGG